MMNYALLLDEAAAKVCPAEAAVVMGIVRTILNAICVAIPIILIVLIVLDLSKIVTAGNLDDKMKKEVTNKVVTRIIFAILIFLVPTVVRLVFVFVKLPENAFGTTDKPVTWQDCWDGK